MFGKREQRNKPFISSPTQLLLKLKLFLLANINLSSSFPLIFSSLLLSIPSNPRWSLSLFPQRKPLWQLCPFTSQSQLLPSSWTFQTWAMVSKETLDISNSFKWKVILILILSPISLLSFADGYWVVSPSSQVHNHPNIRLNLKSDWLTSFSRPFLKTSSLILWFSSSRLILLTFS